MKEDISIKIIIVDDNKAICDLFKNYLKNFNRIKILAIANTDEDEINAIEKYKPDIVITDLMRNRKYTGLEIIKDYNRKGNGPEFLVISADKKETVIPKDVYVAGFIKKPFTDYSIIVEELYRIKSGLLKDKKDEAIKETIGKATQRTLSSKIIKFIKK